MEKQETSKEKSEARGAPFFYEQWKRLQTPAEAARPASSSHPWAQGFSQERRLRAVATDPVENAKKSLDRYKQRLKEYQQYQISLRALQEQADNASPEERARLQQGLRHLEAKLDYLERELSHGYRRTKSAVQECRAAS